MTMTSPRLALSFRAQQDYPRMRMILRSRETCFMLRAKPRVPRLRSE
jgi:hypothetical protein